MVTRYIRGFSHFVTSMTAPIASGWSDSCRVGFAPTEKRRLSTAHPRSRQNGFFSECVLTSQRGNSTSRRNMPRQIITGIKPGDTFTVKKVLGRLESVRVVECTGVNLSDFETRKLRSQYF